MPTNRESAAEGGVDGRRLVAGYVTLNVAAGTAAGVMHLALPLYALSLDATTAQIGLMKGIGGLGMLLLVVPVGFLVDHFGPRRVFRVGAVAGAAVAAAIACSSTPLALILLMGAEGIFGPLRFTALNASFFGRLRTIGLGKAGWFKGSISIGLSFLGPLVGGFLTRNAGFPAVFAVVVLLQLLPATWVSAVEPAAPPQRAAVPLRATVASQLADFAALLAIPSLHPVLAAEMLASAMFSSFSAFVPVIAVRGFGASPVLTSEILILEGSAFILVAFLSGRLAIHRTLLQLVAATTSTAGAVGTALAPGPVSLAAAGAVLGVGLGLVHVLVSSRLGELQGARGKISGLFQAAAGLGVTLGPLACALAGRWVPAQRVLLIFVPPFFLLALAALGRPRPASGPASAHPAPAGPSFIP